MLVGDKYKIESDTMNVTLLEQKVSKDDKERWEVVGYFSSLTNALHHLVDHDIQGLGLEDLKLIEKRQLELHLSIEGIKETIKGLKAQIEPS